MNTGYDDATLKQQEEERLDELFLKIEGHLEILPEWLREAILLASGGRTFADFDTISKRCNYLYDELNGDTDTDTLGAVEETRNLADKAENPDR